MPTAATVHRLSLAFNLGVLSSPESVLTIPNREGIQQPNAWRPSNSGKGLVCLPDISNIQSPDKRITAASEF